MKQQTLIINTRGRGTVEITSRVQEVVETSNVGFGLCNVFLRHTSASLILCENADPSVRGDLETFFSALAPDGDLRFRHTAEGPDDMPAHIRSVLTQSALTIPITNCKLALGTWQGIYLWEHRTDPHRRRLTVTAVGSREISDAK